MHHQLQAQLCERIAATLPIEITSAKLYTEGFDSDVLVVNEQWVFRFPRRPDVAAQLAVEQALLPALGAQLPIAIPQFDMVMPAIDTSLPFVRYPLLPGVPMRAKLVEALAPSQRDRVAAQIGEFLTALHTFPASQAQRIAPAVGFSEREPLSQEYDLVERDIFPLLTLAEQRWVRKLYVAADDQRLWHWERVVTHNDLNSDHILFDTHAQRVSGIIDWGDIQLGDPANDFLALFEYSEVFVETVLRHYALPVDAAFRMRAEILLPRTIFSNLRYLVQHNNHPAIARNLRELRERTTARALQPSHT